MSLPWRTRREAGHTKYSTSWRRHANAVLAKRSALRVVIEMKD
jgi:hypothetical protein